MLCLLSIGKHVKRRKEDPVYDTVELPWGYSSYCTPFICLEASKDKHVKESYACKLIMGLQVLVVFISQKGWFEIATYCMLLVRI